MYAMYESLGVNMRMAATTKCDFIWHDNAQVLWKGSESRMGTGEGNLFKLQS
jgi:hypothetical protein